MKLSGKKLLLLGTLLLVLVSIFVYSLTVDKEEIQQNKTVSVCISQEKGSIAGEASNLVRTNETRTMEESVAINQKWDALEAKVLSYDGYAQDPNCLHILAIRSVVKNDVKRARNYLNLLQAQLQISSDSYKIEEYTSLYTNKELDEVIVGLEERTSKAAQTFDNINMGLSRPDEKTE